MVEGSDQKMMHSSNSYSSRLPGLRGTVPDAGGPSRDGPALLSRDEPVSNTQEIEAMYANAEQARLGKQSLVEDVLNISNVLTDGAAAMVDDSFNKCFTSLRPEPWNWNIYLYPCWVMGVLLRYLILAPLRITMLVISFGSLVLIFLAVDTLLAGMPKQRAAIERRLVQAICAVWVMSWHGVIRYHGPKPMAGPNRIWVSNHTSMIDYAVLCSYSPFAVIMQLHTGWIAFVQKRVLSSLGCLWFNRTEVNDRHIIASRMKAHVSNPDAIPLLIFPEGTCVNNQYTVMFKRGAFDLGATVCPVAIKYNKIFVDAFWNSRRESFSHHLLRLFTSWALVCDVYFLEPQSIQPGETTQDFAGRVQAMIAKYADLRIVPWDGYLKYYNLGEKNPGLIEKRRKVLADQLSAHLTQVEQPTSSAVLHATVPAVAAAAEEAVAGQAGGSKQGKKKQ